jgi:hypothetical protein
MNQETLDLINKIFGSNIGLVIAEKSFTATLKVVNATTNKYSITLTANEGYRINGKDSITSVEFTANID